MLRALQEAMNRFVAEHNRSAGRSWTADPDAVAEKVCRGYHDLASVGRQAG